jgi:hypothetical protein
MAEVSIVGEAEGDVLALDEPLSFWGGVDPTTGEIVDARHPQRGEVIGGRILTMPSARGSSSSASVLAEAIRAGTGPAGIVLGEPDPILVLGALVALELYGKVVPIVVVDPDLIGRIVLSGRVRITGGSVSIEG